MELRLTIISIKKKIATGEQNIITPKLMVVQNQLPVENNQKRTLRWPDSATCVERMT